MAIFKCKMCGGNVNFTDGATVGVCDSCGTKQTLPRLDDDRRANLYDRANHFRRNNEFDKAAGIYEQILNEDPSDAEAYWSLVLCQYGIEYVEDPATRKRVPTVNRAQFTSIFDDDNYKSALQYADADQRGIYEAEASAINEIQKGILAISQKEEPFDVFICYKETDNNGRRTPDSVLANDLYHQLTREGFKVFFARITLEDKLGTAYEPYIFAALNSAKVMVVLGTKPEYFNAVWVKNEWSRYLALVKKSGGKKVLIPAYKDMDPYDLPEEFSHLQAQDMSKLGFMQDLIRGIKKLVNATGAAPVPGKEAVVIGGASVAPLLKRAALFLEDGDWEEATEYCEKVLDQDPENAQAYLYKLMAELQVHKQSDLSSVDHMFDQNGNYQKIMRFGSDDLRQELDSINNEIQKRIARRNKEIDEIAETLLLTQVLNSCSLWEFSIEQEQVSSAKYSPETTAQAKSLLGDAVKLSEIISSLDLECSEDEYLPEELQRDINGERMDLSERFESAVECFQKMSSELESNVYAAIGALNADPTLNERLYETHKIRLSNYEPPIELRVKQLLSSENDDDYIDMGDDPLLPRAVEMVISQGMASTAGLQRSLGVGHSRAGRIMDQMERKGYVGPYQGIKPRDVLISYEQWNEIRLTEGQEKVTADKENHSQKKGKSHTGIIIPDEIYQRFYAQFVHSPDSPEIADIRIRYKAISAAYQDAHEKNNTYKQAIKLTKNSSVAKIEDAITLFQSLSGWRDSEEQILACRAKIEELNIAVEQQRIDRKRRKEAEKRRNKEEQRQFSMVRLFRVITISLSIFIMALTIFGALSQLALVLIKIGNLILLVLNVSVFVLFVVGKYKLGKTTQNNELRTKVEDMRYVGPCILLVIAVVWTYTVLKM